MVAAGLNSAVGRLRTLNKSITFVVMDEVEEKNNRSLVDGSHISMNRRKWGSYF